MEANRERSLGMLTISMTIPDAQGPLGWDSLVSWVSRVCGKHVASGKQLLEQAGQGAKPGIAAHSQYEMPVGHLERVGHALLELDDFSLPWAGHSVLARWMPKCPSRAPGGRARVGSARGAGSCQVRNLHQGGFVWQDWLGGGRSESDPLGIRMARS